MSHKERSERKPIKIVDLPCGSIERWPNAKEQASCAEKTGKGDLLVIDGFLGRMFRSDEGCVRDELNEFIRRYNESCMRLDEDPAGEYFEVMNWNDLYTLHGLIPNIAGDMFGYTNSEDYRVDLAFDVRMVEDGEFTERFGEKYLYYEPMEFCLPDPCYKEV